MRTTARAVLSDPYWDGALEELQEDGLLREEDDPPGNAPPASTFDNVVCDLAAVTSEQHEQFAYEDGEGENSNGGSGSSEESDDGVVFDEMDEHILGDSWLKHQDSGRLAQTRLQICCYVVIRVRVTIWVGSANKTRLYCEYNVIDANTTKEAGIAPLSPYAHTRPSTKASNIEFIPYV
jgi:hypothetical protein